MRTRRSAKQANARAAFPTLESLEADLRVPLYRVVEEEDGSLGIDRDHPVEVNAVAVGGEVPVGAQLMMVLLERGADGHLEARVKFTARKRSGAEG